MSKVFDLFRITGGFLRYSRPHMSLVHPQMMEQIAVPLTKVVEVRRVEKIVLVMTPYDTHTFHADSEATAAEAFENLLMPLKNSK